MGKKCPLLCVCTVCTCFDTSRCRVGTKRSIDLQDYRWTLTAERSSWDVFLFLVCRCCARMKGHILMQFAMAWASEKGKKRFAFGSTAAQLIVEHIKNRLCTVNWSHIYLILNESQNILGSFVTLASHLVPFVWWQRPLVLLIAIIFIRSLSHFGMHVWSQFTHRAHPSSSRKLFSFFAPNEIFFVFLRQIIRSLPELRGWWTLFDGLRSLAARSDCSLTNLATY
jgi:hypothetical protein